MSFKALLGKIRANAFEEYPDPYFNRVALDTYEGYAEFAPQVATALEGTPYSVVITERGGFNFLHIPTGHLVTHRESSVRREFVEAKAPLSIAAFTRGRRL